MSEAVILSSLAGLEAMRGGLDEARVAYERARAIYAELELPLFVSALSVISGPIELLAGDAERAERTLRLGIELLADRGAADAVAYRSALLAPALLAQGKRAAAGDVLAAAEPARLMTRIAYASQPRRVHDDLSAREMRSTSHRRRRPQSARRRARDARRPPRVTRRR